jgi:hypothetical protein
MLLLRGQKFLGNLEGNHSLNHNFGWNALSLKLELIVDHPNVTRATFYHQIYSGFLH